MLKVTGDDNLAIYSGKLDDSIYQPEGQPSLTTEAVAAPKGVQTKDQRIAEGKKIFNQSCFACHQANGMGLPGIFPPLANSDYLNADHNRAIGVIINGQEGEIVVNGVKYNQVMPPQILNDDDVANVMTFILNSWGNSGDMITPEQVQQVRSGH